MAFVVGTSQGTHGHHTPPEFGPDLSKVRVGCRWDSTDFDFGAHFDVVADVHADPRRRRAIFPLWFGSCECLLKLRMLAARPHFRLALDDARIRAHVQRQLWIRDTHNIVVYRRCPMRVGWSDNDTVKEGESSQIVFVIR